MTDNNAEEPQQNDAEGRGLKKVTSFGEPLWKDALKSIGVGLIMLVIVVVVGGALGVAIIAPWGRASHDCSIYCVIDRQLGGIFFDKKS